MSAANNKFSDGQMVIPQPPIKPDLDLIHRYLLSLDAYLRGQHLNGLNVTNMTQTTIDSMITNNDLSQAGKFFFNTNTGTLQKANITGGTTLTVTDIG